MRMGVDGLASKAAVVMVGSKDATRGHIVQGLIHRRRRRVLTRAEDLMPYSFDEPPR